MGKLRVTAGAVALVLLVGACGEEDKGPSAAEYIAAADRLCLRAQERVEDLDDDFQDFDDVKRFATNAAKIGNALMTDLQALEVPDDLTEDVDDFNAEFTKGLRLIRQLGKAAEDENTTRIEELADEVDEQDKKLEPIARKIGYEECGIPDEDEEEDSDSGADAPADDEAAADDTTDDTAEDTGDDSGDDSGDDAGDDEPPVNLDEIQTALEDAGVEFLATDDVASLEEDSDPPPFESAAFETDDGSAIFEILVYTSNEEARAAKAGINAAAGCGDEGSTTICAGAGNAILVIDGDGPTVEEIGQIFTETMNSA